MSTPREIDSKMFLVTQLRANRRSSVSKAGQRATFAGILSLAVLVLGTGCGRQVAASSNTGSSAGARDDFVQVDDDTTDAERTYLQFGREVFVHVATRNYDAFFEQLAAAARSRLSVNQFTPSGDDAEFARNEARPRQNVGLLEFRELMKATEHRFGRPVKPIDLHVHSSDAAVLSGEPRQGLDALDAMFAIGNMPKLVPAAQRRASLRGQLRVELSAEQLAEAARAYETTAEELANDPDFEPYLTLKLVIVEEGGHLRVGYFEFLPPSMLD